MIKVQTVLEVKKNDRAYTLTLDPSSPLGEVHDVLQEMKHFVIGKMQEAEKPAQEEQPSEA